MKKLFVNEWHGIELKEICNLSSRELADSSFYKRFYTAFFSRYQKWQDLNPEWLKSKLAIAEAVMSKFPDASANILSIGSGLGVIEQPFLRNGYRNLHINETDRASLRWISPQIPEENVHLGFVPDCLPKGVQFDGMYMILVDYCFTNTQLVEFLKSVKPFLKSGGRFVLASSQISKQNLLQKFKTSVWEKCIALGIKKSDQFWGYLRTEEEFKSIFRRADLTVEYTEYLESNVLFTLVKSN